jgi:dethiobiotin synthetase
MTSPRGVFITGTDTGVGKTYCAAALVREMGRRGIDVGVMKPAETGCQTRGGKLVPSDALHLVRAAGARDLLSGVNPYRFSQPLAPSLAAELENGKIRKSRILKSFKTLTEAHEFMVVEGAGGVLVPLAGRYTFLDLAADLGLPVLIVARPGLGTINHTLLTVLALQARNLQISGIVINYAAQIRPGAAEKTGPSEIERLSGIAILGTLRHGSEEVKGIVDRVLSPCRSRGRW